MRIRGKYEVTLRFETEEDVPEQFIGLAKELVETQNQELVPVKDNFLVMMEVEFGAENIEIVDFKMKVEEIPDEA